MSSSIMNKLKKNSKIADAEVIEESLFFKPQELIDTNVPMMNVALSGDINGGLSKGLTVLAGKSKHFKTSFALVMAASFQRKNPDGVVIFYDSEFGSPPDYFESFGCDMSRILHVPIKHIEELKFDLVGQLDQLSKDDKVMVIIDSIGNLASLKELEDTLDEKSKTDMTRAKAYKGLFRMVTPYLAMKDIPLIAINHTYQEMGLYPKEIVSGGTGIMYSAQTVWIIGRRQNKKAGEVTGYDFVINIEKSRFIKEKSQIPISVSWDAGVERLSGLLDIALAGGFVSKPSNGWYQHVDLKTGELVGTKVREKDTLTEEFWEDLLTEEKFLEFVKDTYMINKGNPDSIFKLQENVGAE